MAVNPGDTGPRPARVSRTGIALVHEGELILPAAGSEAEGVQVLDDSRTSIQYIFPVEIEVRFASEPVHHDAIADHVLNRLYESAQGQIL